MKVVQVLPELNAGGVERGTLELAGHLVREGHEAVVVSAGGRLVETLERLGARHVLMPVHRKSVWSLWQVRAMRKFLERERPDVVHVRSRVPAWIVWLAWRGMAEAGRPRLVSTVHGFHSVNRYSEVMTCGERVIAVSGSIREQVMRDYPRVEAGRIRVVPRGVDPAVYHPGYRPPVGWLERWEAEFPRAVGKVGLLLPGRITRLKGHEEFLRLVAELVAGGMPVHGLVVGGVHPRKQAYFEELKGLVERLGISHAVDFAGHRDDLREIMAVSGMVFSLSRQPEAFGRTVLEAVALGRPVVGYDRGGVGEVLAEFFPAGRVGPDDFADLMAVTRRLLEEPRVPEGLRVPYTLEAMCEGTLAVYRELVG